MSKFDGPTAGSVPGRSVQYSRQTGESNGRCTECPRHGRTQWDAMAEVTSNGKFRSTRLAFLILIRYGPRTSAGAGVLALAYKLIEILGQHH